MNNFSKYLEELNFPHPHNDIIKAIDDMEFPFFDNLFFKEFPSYLAFEEFKKCHSLFTRKLKHNFNYSNFSFGTNEYKLIMKRYFEVMSEIKVIEYNHKEELQKIAEEIIREIYGVDEGLKLNPLLGDSSSFDFSTNSEDEEDCENEDNEEASFVISKDRLLYIYDLAQKRIILNSIIHGSSIHIWKSSHYIAKDKIDAIDTKLIGLYDEYATIVSIMLWMYPPKQMEVAISSNEVITQGFSNIGKKLSKDKESDDSFDDEMEEEYQEYLRNNGIEEDLYGNAVGNVLPVLLHELNKVVFESLCSHSIPDDLSERELKIYYGISDQYKDEIWHYFLGPTLWTKLFSFINEKNLEIYEVFHAFSRMDYTNFAKFCLYLFDEHKSNDINEFL